MVATWKWTSSRTSRMTRFRGPASSATNTVVSTGMIWPCYGEERLTRCCPDADSHLIVIASDSMPNRCFNYIEYSGASARRNVCMIVDRMERGGTEVVCFALSENSSLSGEMMYPHVLECREPGQLPQRLFDVLSEAYGRFRHFV